MTLGEDRVRLSFNPGGNEQVRVIKELAANLIDEIDQSGGDERCLALAMTAIEEGCMWAVKAVTMPPE